MKTRIFISIVIFTIFSFSVVSAQVKTTKVIGARVYSQAEFDSVKAELNKLDDASSVNVGLLRKVMTYLHDITLRDGHKEYVSMPSMAKNGVANKLNSDINDVACSATGMDYKINDLQVVVSGDQTPLTVVVPETKILAASELAMQRIKERVAALRATQK